MNESAYGEAVTRMGYSLSCVGILIPQSLFFTIMRNRTTKAGCSLEDPQRAPDLTSD